VALPYGGGGGGTIIILTQTNLLHSVLVYQYGGTNKIRIIIIIV
jgi:hypothetical protein